MPALFLAVFAFLVMAKPAHAYIDAGTGSMVIQFFVAAVAGGVFAIKSCWHNIRSFFSKNRGTQPTDPATKDSAPKQ